MTVIQMLITAVQLYPS